jgi:NTP pyrophosphatase (non-canonical NTP hydrolase)
MSNLKTLITEVLAFRDARDWAQFHNTKDLALGLSIEAAELNELFLWKSAEDVDVNRLREELADILIYAILIAHNHDLDLPEIIREKLAINNQKYPVEKSKGSAKKYNELEP